MSLPTLPFRIEFSLIGELQLGYMSIANFENSLPFVPQRAFWTYYTPQNVIRGRHAHWKTEMVLIAVHGRILLETESLDGQKAEFWLDKPDEGVYLPALSWHTMKYSHDAVQLVFASTQYDPQDYIRDYATFCEIGGR
jgi:dTDP-4-dehydrorhamnose 3,5-epimerase-like enzyme